MQCFSKNKNLILFCFVFFQLSCWSQKNDAQQQPVASTELRQDFDILRKTLEEAHPGLYWYTDSIVMNHFFDSVKMLLDRDMTSLEFYKKILPVIANVRCVHTSLRLPQQGGTAKFKRMLPFDFFCQSRKVYIHRSFNGEKNEGTEVLAINNVEVKKILQTLMQSIPADGYNESFKYQLLSNGAFREGYALFFGQPETFTILALNKIDLQPYSFTVPATSPNKIPLIPGPASPPFVLNFYKNTAVLSVNTFEMNTRRFRDSVVSIFETIAKNGAQKLIIDLRQNGGGTNDNVSTLYSFIASAPFLHLKRAEMKAASLTYAQYISRRQDADRIPENKLNAGIFEVNDRYAGTSTKEPVDKNFNGKVVLLTSGKTTSAASEFAAIAQYLKRAKIVGEETGGCYYGASGGNYINLTLPNTRLEIRIPTIRIFTAVDEDFILHPKGQGTLPDYPILPSIKDILNGNDIQLEKAVAILNINSPA